MADGALSALIGVVVNTVVNLLLIPPLGALGAAISTPIGTAAFLLATQRWAGRYATWHFPAATAARASVAAAGWAGAVAVVHLVESVPAALAGAAVAGGIVYLAALTLLGERRRGHL
ncbi:MAG TPA: polysaccharide biosynthesis C-terminal domain-containing protein [Gaiellaceae bacterium]|nr:polysaccharide biosynthesis C-terminal domain-containing protein [Gaiellaceae bacterium]